MVMKKFVYVFHLRKLREAKKLSQAAIAGSLGVQQAYISKLELEGTFDKIPLDGKQIHIICTVLNCGWHDLFELKEVEA